MAKYELSELLKICQTPLAGNWSVSPDGKLLALVQLDKSVGENRIFVRSLESNEMLNVLDSEAQQSLTWTRDDKALAYVYNTDELSKIIRVSLATGEKQIVAEFPNERIFGFDRSFDGKRLAVVRGKIVSDAVLIKAE
jgi:Tol biopolymer transport system component